MASRISIKNKSISYNPSTTKANLPTMDQSKHSISIPITETHQQLPKTWQLYLQMQMKWESVEMEPTS